MNYLYFLVNRITYRLFFFRLIPILGIIIGSIYNLLKGYIFPSPEYFTVIIIQIIGPYFIGGGWLLMFSIYRGKISKEKQNQLLKNQSKSLTDNLDMDVFNFKYYSRLTFYAWIV